MGLKEAFQKWAEKRNEEKEEFKAMERNLRLHRRLEQKQKSVAQKELEFYQREEARENLNNLLKQKRKDREEKMKNLSNPFNKNNDFLCEKYSIMGGGMRWT